MIYRLEYEDGKGVFYHGRMSRVLTASQRERAYRHPGPISEREGVWNADKRRFDYPLGDVTSNDGNRFGFLTQEQGRSWFTRKACERLASDGVLLVVYRREDCRYVVEGQLQCCFAVNDGAEPAHVLPASALWERIAA